MQQGTLGFFASVFILNLITLRTTGPQGNLCSSLSKAREAREKVERLEANVEY